MNSTTLSLPAQPASAGGVACRADGLIKRYGAGETAVVALNQLSLAVSTGTFTAVMGPSGSGKSSLLHCLAGLDRAETGEVYIGDVELGGLDDRRLARFRRDHVGFIFQAFNLVPSLTAHENILLPALLGGRSPDDEWLEHLVDVLDIRDRLHHLPSQLSGGQQQRVAAARALAGRPAVVFADEPTGNLDTAARHELLGLLRRCVDDDHQTVVMVTHDPVAAAVADSTVVLRDGQIVDTFHGASAEAIAASLTGRASK